MEKEEAREVVVFYDDPCIDGAASAWAIHQAFKDKEGVDIEYVPIGYGRPEERKQKILSHLRDGVEAIFVDTSPKDITLDALLKPGKNDPKIKSLTVIDHHASEVTRLENYKKKLGKPRSGPSLVLHVDPMQPSTAAFAWEIYNADKPAPKLLEWVGKMEPPVTLKTDRDFAVASYIDSKDIFTSTEQAFKTLDDLAATDETSKIEQGNAIMANQFNNTKGLRGVIRFANLELLPGVKRWVPIVNANVQNFGRRINQALLEEARAGTTCGVIGAWHVQGDGSVKLSLRTTGMPDASLIAKHLGNTIGIGGGGHPTDAVTQFANLRQFTDGIETFSRDEMLRQEWAEAERDAASQINGAAASVRRTTRRSK